MNVDISVPLCPGIFLPRDNLNDIWISLKYERLPEVCYRCGIIGHMENICYSEQVLLSNEHGFKFQAFDDWLKIENDKMPPGIYEIPPVETQVVEDVPGVSMLAIDIGARTEFGVLEGSTKLVDKRGVESTIVVLSGHKDVCNVGECSNLAEVSAFARILEHTLKDVGSTSVDSVPILSGRVTIRCGESSVGEKCYENIGPPTSPCNDIPVPTTTIGLDPILSSLKPNISYCEVQSNNPLSSRIQPIEHPPTLINIVDQTCFSKSDLVPSGNVDLSEAPGKFLTSCSTDSELKRKEHPDSPKISSKKARFVSSTVEASFLDPDQSHLNAYLLEKDDKKEARKHQLGGYHLSMEDSVVYKVGCSCPYDFGAVVKEVGSFQPPPSQ